MKDTEIYFVYDSQVLLEECGVDSFDEVDQEDFINFIFEKDTSLRLTREELDDTNLTSYDSYVKVKIIEEGEVVHNYSLLPKKSKNVRKKL